MRNKCLLGLGLVFVISLTSMVAFAFSFTGTPADEVDETEMIVRAVVLRKRMQCQQWNQSQQLDKNRKW